MRGSRSVGRLVGRVSGWELTGEGGERVCGQVMDVCAGGCGDVPSCCLRFGLSKQTESSCVGIFTFANLALSPPRLVLRRPHLVAVAAAGARVLFARDLRRTFRYYPETMRSSHQGLLG